MKIEHLSFKKIFNFKSQSISPAPFAASIMKLDIYASFLLKHHGSVAKASLINFFGGSFQPIVDIGNDFKKTFTRYKSSAHLYRDVFVLFIGIKNIMKGLSYGVICLPFLIYSIFRFDELFTGPQGWHGLSPRDKYLLRLSTAAAWCFKGPMEIVRGGIQIISTPLTYLIRLPLRYFLGKGKDYPDAIDNPGVQRIIAVLNDPSQIARHDDQRSALEHKYIKCMAGNEQPAERLYSFMRRNHFTDIISPSDFKANSKKCS